MIEASIWQNGSVVRQRTFRDSVTVHDFARTTSSQEYRITVQGFLLDPGYYELVVNITDLETRRTVVQKNHLRLRRFSDDALSISDLELARDIQPDQDAENPFVKNGRFVEPNPSRAYGYLASTISLYYELYGLAEPKGGAGDSIIVKYTIRTPGGAVRKVVQRRTRKPGTSCVHSVVLPIADLSGGRYIVEVEARDSAYPEYAVRSRKEFVLGWDLLTLGSYSTDELIDQLALVASEQEVASLRRLPESYRRAGILSFWKGRDPTPETDLNELMIEFYRRVAFANKKFKSVDRPGWRTDQGKIFIKFGPPDSIERYLSGAPNRPYEIWEYLNPRRKFVFIGGRGSGDYQLFTEAVSGSSPKQ